MTKEYKPEKKLREELFILFHLYNMAKYGWLEDKEATEIEDCFNKKIQTYSTKNPDKWKRMIIRFDCKTGFYEFYKSGASARKVVMILYSILQDLIDNHYEIDEEVAKYTEKVLELEHKDEVEEKDWVFLRDSAVKQGKKLLAKMQQEGWFLVNSKIPLARP